MAQKISIGVDAQLDTSDVERKINDMGRKVAQANKVQFNPVSVSSIDQVAKLEKQFQQLLKVHAELNRRVKSTGQSGNGFTGMDYNQIFPDANVRNRQMRQIMEYTLGSGVFGPGVQGGGGGGPGPGIPPHPGRPVRPGGGGGGGGGGIIMPAVQAGMRAMGPAGGVAAGALGTGMSAGFGAGLMGLLGGMLALGVGKIVSGAMEKVSQAEDNSVALDKLKRTLGDVNVSFNGLKAVVNGGAENLRITYAEAGKLATQFAKLGNMRSGQYTSLSDELGVGVGLARSFGLDPEQGVGVMGEARGVGVTGNTTESKRFALLIGETIAKSDAFAKADEVISAIGNFAVTQTRNNLGAANTAGYAGAFSALVGSGIPGLDPSGAGALLGRINSSLAAGGAKGEASQYFTGMLGARRGMDVFDTQLWREGGAFSTANSTFQGGGAVSQFYDKYGIKKPGGNETLLAANLGQLKQQYGNSPKMMLNATANQMGLSMQQAAALHLINPNQMGEMEQYAGDLTKLNGAGIGNIAKVFSKNPEDRRGVAESLLARQDVSQDDKAAIKNAMTKGEEVQKQTLAKIVAQYDQEQTTGKDVRDSKNALDNIKTSIADKLVPYFNEARLGIMSIAGVGGKTSSDDIMRKVIDANSEGRKAAITGQFDPEIKSLWAKNKEAMDSAKINNDVSIYEAAKSGNPELAEKMKRAQEQAFKDMREIAARLEQIEEEKIALLKRENAAREREIENLEKQAAKRMMSEISGDGEGAGAGRGSGYDPLAPDSGRVYPIRSGGSAPPGSPAAPDTYDNLFIKYGKQYGVDPKLLKAIAMKESGMRPGIVSGVNPNGTVDKGLMQHNSAYLASRGLTDSWSDPDRSIEEAAKLLQSNIARGGSVRSGVRMYNGSGPRAEAYADDVMRRYGSTKMKNPDGTPLPDTGAGSIKDAGTPNDKVASIRVELVHYDQHMREKRPRQIAQTSVKSNWATA